MALELKRYRFTVDEYQRMAEAGIFGEDDRVELIEGEIVQMTPIGRRHAVCVTLLTDLLSRAYGHAALISVQNPMRLGKHSEPQPDLALLRRGQHVDFVPEHVLLLVEVAASSAEPDRRIKVPLYARGGIREMWLVDLEQETVTVYLDATQHGYRTVRVFRRGEELAPAAFPDQPVAVDDILTE